MNKQKNVNAMQIIIWIIREVQLKWTKLLEILTKYVHCVIHMMVNLLNLATVLDAQYIKYMTKLNKNVYVILINILAMIAVGNAKKDVE